VTERFSLAKFNPVEYVTRLNYDSPEACFSPDLSFMNVAKDAGSAEAADNTEAAEDVLVITLFCDIGYSSPGLPDGIFSIQKSQFG
jgi:hypothetical protein